MFIFCILNFILIIILFVFLFNKIKLLEDELDELYDTCYYYISDSFKKGVHKNDY